MPQDPQDLYKRILMQHSREPRNKRAINQPTRKIFLANALCGDEISMYLKIDDNQLKDVAFEAQCCAICMASASMLTEKVVGMTTDAAREAASEFIGWMNDGSANLPFEDGEDLGALSGVKAFAGRIRCATLPWEALSEALKPSS